VRLKPSAAAGVRLMPTARAGVRVKPAAGAEVRLKTAAGAGVSLKPAAGAGVRLKPAAGAGVRLKPVADAEVRLKPGYRTGGVSGLGYLDSRRTGHSSDLELVVIRLAEMQVQEKLHRKVHLNKGLLADPY